MGLLILTTLILISSSLQVHFKGHPSWISQIDTLLLPVRNTNEALCVHHPPHVVLPGLEVWLMILGYLFKRKSRSPRNKWTSVLSIIVFSFICPSPHKIFSFPMKETSMACPTPGVYWGSNLRISQFLMIPCPILYLSVWCPYWCAKHSVGLLNPEAKPLSLVSKSEVSQWWKTNVWDLVSNY